MTIGPESHIADTGARKPVLPSTEALCLLTLTEPSRAPCENSRTRPAGGASWLEIAMCFGRWFWRPLPR
jgi:hypothetical protein